MRLVLAALIFWVTLSAEGFSADLKAGAEGACLKGAPAFPGAVGWGRCATGWRGGQIVRVTNTNDSGAGSLRNCLKDTSGPRICIFDVGGTIEINEPLTISEGNVYIAGQSAPADSGGIQITLAATNASNPTLRVLQADHVLIRHIRLRPGPGQVSNTSVSAFVCRNCRHLMLDNVSMSYATDQNLTIVAENFSGIPERGITRYVTVQHSIMSYGLYNANHSLGTHSKGAIICNISTGNFAGGDRCGYITFYGNLLAHNNDRNPEFQASGEPADIVNNVIYNHVSDAFEVADVNATSQYNVISNALFEGPNTVDATPPRLVECRDDVVGVGCDVYAFGNIDEDNRPSSNAGAETDVFDPTLTPVQLTAPVDTITGAFIRADDLMTILGPEFGAVKPARDALDTITVADVLANTGARVDDPSDVTGAGLTGGFPTLATGTAPTDTDGDGMPDNWELAFDDGTFWANAFNAWGDRDSDGWSNLEEYLNFLAGDISDPRP